MSFVFLPPWSLALMISLAGLRYSTWTTTSANSQAFTPLIGSRLTRTVALGSSFLSARHEAGSTSQTASSSPQMSASGYKTIRYRLFTHGSAFCSPRFPSSQRIADAQNSRSIDDVLDAKAHGARSDDVIGSLYFYLADELRNFSNRLRRFKISIHLFSLPPLELARSLAAGNFASAGLPPTFDRIDIGESIDVAQVETGEMLEAWGPKLSSTNPHAAIVGSSRSWYLNVVGGRPGPGDESLVEELAESGRVRDRSSFGAERN